MFDRGCLLMIFETFVRQYIVPMWYPTLPNSTSSVDEQLEAECIKPYSFLVGSGQWAKECFHGSICLMSR